MSHTAVSIDIPTASTVCQDLNLAIPTGGGVTLVNLSEAPQTIGAGPRCTIRLKGPGLRPIHCVITPTANGPVARRWAVETLLDGAEFTETLLTGGEQLQVGEHTLEVVGGNDSEELDQSELVSDTDFDASADTFAPEESDDNQWLATETPGEESVEQPRDDQADSAAEATLATVADLTDQLSTSDSDDQWAFSSPEAPVDAADWNPRTNEEVESCEDDAPAIPKSAGTWAVQFDKDELRNRSTEASVAEEFSPEAADLDAIDETAPDESSNPIESFQTTPAVVAQLRQRLASNRRRVASLVAALRQRHAEIDTLESVVAQRDELITELQSKLQEALDAGEAARAELAQWRSSTSEAAIEEVESLAEVDSPVEDSLDEFADQSNDAATLQAKIEQELADAEATAPTDPGTDSIESFYRPETDATSNDPQEDAEPWGIEQLATEESLPTASLWEATPDSADDVVDDAPSSAEVAEIATTDGQLESEVEPSEELEQLFEEEAAEITQTADEGDFFGADEENAEPIGADPNNEDEPTPIAELIAKAAAKTAFVPPERASGAPHQAPQSFIEQYADSLIDDETPVEAPVPLETIESDESNSELDGDEDSIDDYMRKLMQRVRGSTSPPELPAPTVNIETTEHETTNTETTNTDPNDTEPDEATSTQTPARDDSGAPFRDLSEINRGPLRKSTTDMGALRQLANQSARDAISVATTRDNREQASLRLFGSVVAVGGGLFATITATNPMEMQFLFGVLGLVAGGWFGLKTLQSCQSTIPSAEAAPQDEEPSDR